MMRNAPVLVLKQNTKREQGRKTQLANIEAGKAIAEVVRTTLGPKSMLKMLLDPMGGLVMTNDGNAILREVDVAHPAAKSLIELSRSQDEEVGDGTTSVVVLAGELLSVAEPLLTVKALHPTIIVSGYLNALRDALEALDAVAIPVDPSDDKKILEIVHGCILTKFSVRWGTLISDLAVKAAKCVTRKLPNGKIEIDTKRYARIEKIPGGALDECTVLDGVLLNKDVTHPKMRRYIKDPKVCLLDCPLEYKKGESATNVELTRQTDFEALLREEELEVQRMCDNIIATGCDLVITEKGVSDLAQHFLVKKGISVIRRVRKTDNNRISRVTGATICHRTDELTPSDIGKQAGEFKIEKIGDEYYTYIIGSVNSSACSIVLRGASKDVLNEVERNLHDALSVARNILLENKLCPGGGATEMEVASRLGVKAKSVEGSKGWAYKAVATALEVIPRTLAQNCGVDVVRTITALRSKHATPGQSSNYGLDGNTGEIIDVTTEGIYDTFAVKQQIIKSAIEAAAMLLRIDDIVSGIGQKSRLPGGGGGGAEGAEESFGDARDG